MAYSLTVAPQAERQFRKLPEKTREQIGKEFDALREDPRHHGVIKLTNSDAYRARVGDFRIIFEIVDSRLIVTVIKILDRKEAYK